MIECQNLSKTFKVHVKDAGLKGSIRSLFARKYQTKHAVKNVNLKIEAGEIVGLVGANGAGKTTLVKMLSGIVHPSSGEAKVLGYRPWERNNKLRSQMSLIMGQKASLWWDLPAEDCYLLLREIYQIPHKDYKERLDFLANALNVKDQLNVQIRKLSLGERMKVELIAALLHQPKVVYLDEPTIGLDLTTQKAIRQFILEYRNEHSPAMILTSHYMEDIAQLCQRLIIIKDGEFIFDGPIEHITDRFASEKYIKAILDPGKTQDNVCLDLPNELGELQECTSEFIRVKVHKNQLTKTTSYLLDSLPVIDINIDNTDLADIIETLMRDGV